jgi:hypothetical protein
MTSSLANLFALINDVLQAAIVIFGSAVILYNVPHVRRDRVTGAFSGVILFVVIVYFTELLASRTLGLFTAEVWLRIGLFGITFVPAAVYHLSDALLATTGAFSTRRRLSVAGVYLLGAAMLAITLGTESIVTGLAAVPRAPHLLAGPLFPLFALYYVAVSAIATYNVWYARRRCVTTTTRRRMTAILATFPAAPLGVFPYQTISEATEVRLVIWITLIVGNLVVALMFALLTYYLAYFGRVSPDRVVRVRLFKFMARVPMTGTLVLLVHVLTNRASPILGLPTETMLAISVVLAVMIVEWAVHYYKRPLERVLQLNNEPDVRRIQELSERILTTRDLHQFLESILTAICDTLRTPTAFVAALTPNGPRLEVVVGPLRTPQDLWTSEPWQELATGAGSKLARAEMFILWQNYWIRPLYARGGESMLGILGIEGRSDEPDLTDLEQDVFERLVEQAEAALEDRLLQQEVFAAVEGLLPKITALQQLRSAATYGSPTQLTRSLTRLPEAESEPAAILADPKFSRMVRDALSHYWGGPKLADSPLQGLRVVQEALYDHEGNATKALRAILQSAIERQRPEGERRMTTAEWILYNILEMKFVQGQKVRDVARRLAMSESDLYRKQRVAIENVADAVMQMELDALGDGTQEPQSTVASSDPVNY